MAKPRKANFGDLFEPVLVGAWGLNQDVLDGALLEKTWSAITEMRQVYRFKDVPYPSKLKFSVPKNMAGYLGAFGERHAYLAYLHLKEVEKVSKDATPNPNDRGELTVTAVGAGAAVELYGVCLFYNEFSHKMKVLRVNLIERVEQWKPARVTVIGGLLKQKFPRVRIHPTDVDVDLTADCIQNLAHYYDRLKQTDILLIYNVMNEIETRYASEVWRNISFIIKICDHPLLILVAEPTAPKAWPRIKWLREKLAECTRVIISKPDVPITFTEDPVRVAFEGTGKGLNDRLFRTSSGDQRKPTLQTSMRRMLMACAVSPMSPISQEDVERQLRAMKVKRIDGRFAPRPQAPKDQYWLPGLEE